MEPTILELRTRRTKNLADMKSIADSAKLMKRQLTDEERTTLTALGTEDDQLKTQIDRLEAEENARAKIAKIGSELDESLGRRTGPETGTPIPATLRRDPPTDPKKGFKNHTDFLYCVLQAGLRGNIDERLRPLYRGGKGETLTAGSDEAGFYSDPSGGFLIPEGFMPSVLTIKPEDDPMGALITKVPMQNPIVKIPSRVDRNHNTSVAGGLTVTRKPESAAANPAQMKFEQVVLEAHSLFGLGYASEEILTDSPMSFAALLAKGFSEQFIWQLIQERLNGSGVGEYLGVLNSKALVSVAKETGQQAKSLVYENVLGMRSRCWGYARAIWIANHDTIPQLMLLNQGVGTGGLPVWVPMGGAQNGVPDMLLGRPIIFSEYAQTLGTQGDLTLCNWGEYLEGEYQPLQSAESIHVRFVNHERVFKFWTRNAGQPWWKDVLTPVNSTSTMSPFVTLDARA